MNKELALRTFAYLNRHYKTHNATIINKQEIEAIEFILNDNEFLEQQCKKQKEVIDKAIEYIKETKLKEFEKSYGKRYGKTFTQAEVIVCNMILNKMQELQGSRE